MKNEKLAIKVGEHNYSIKLTTQKNTSLGEGNRGKIYYEELDIYLDKELPKTRMIETFYHELSHAICENTSFNAMLEDKLGDNGYEIFIDNLGKTIYNLIHNNNLNEIEKKISER